MQEITKGRAALSGAIAAAAGLAVVATVPAFVPGARSPLLSIGDLVVDASPPWLKDWAIDTFGAADKAVLLWSMVAVVIALGAVAGLLATKRLIAALALVDLAALGAGVAVWADPLNETVPSLLVVVAGALVASLLLVLLLRMGAESDDDEAADESKRRFLLAAGGTAAGAVLVGVVGRSLSTRMISAADRAGIRLPSPADAAGPVPAGLAGAETPLIVPNGDFYLVDTALSTPSVMLDEWQLDITGMVDTPYTLRYEDLMGLPMIERHITIACVSNRVGGEYVGNATWQGVPLARILERAGVQDGATQLVGRSVDDWTAGFPTEVAFDGRDAMVAVAMNGQPLPPEHGFPARLIVPGLYGYVSATKWLREIELTTWDGFDAYWVPRGWAKEGPVKTQSRIDRPGGEVPAGATVVAGVAWAPTRGIEKVELQVDDEAWVECELSESMSDDAWRQWAVTVDLASGSHQLRVRATDGTGQTQSEAPVRARPDGAEGWHTVTVDAV